MALPLLLAALTLNADASCLPSYRRAVAVNTTGVVTATTALVGVSVFTAVAVQSLPTPDDEVNTSAVFGLLLALAVIAPPSALTSSVAGSRDVGLVRARRLIEEAQLGDGPALRALAAELEAELERSVTPVALAAVINTLDEGDAFCADPVPDAYWRARARIRAALPP